MSDSSARATDKKKKGAGGDAATAAALQSNVFDTHGNDLLGLHMQTAQAGMKAEGTESESLLQLASNQQVESLESAGPDQRKGTEEEEELLALRQQAAAREQDAPGASAASVAGSAVTQGPGATESEISKDDALAMARGDSERDDKVDGGELKKTLLEGSGTEILMQFMNEAQAELEMPPMNPDAQRAVVAQVAQQIDERALVRAKNMDEVNEVLRQALRENALRAREEVILLLMRLMSSPKDMEAMGSLAEKGDRAIQVIEYIAEFTAELDDLHALAAYDHRDLMHDIPVISTEAMEVRRYLSPLALHLGTFAPVVYQMVVNQLARTEGGGKVDESAEGEQANTRPLQGALLNVLNDMRLARFLEG